jgi:hypothetical protein
MSIWLLFIMLSKVLKTNIKGHLKKENKKVLSIIK